MVSRSFSAQLLGAYWSTSSTALLVAHSAHAYGFFQSCPAGIPRCRTLFPQPARHLLVAARVASSSYARSQPFLEVLARGSSARLTHNIRYFPVITLVEVMRIPGVAVLLIQRLCYMLAFTLFETGHAHHMSARFDMGMAARTVVCPHSSRAARCWLCTDILRGFLCCGAGTRPRCAQEIV